MHPGSQNAGDVVKNLSSIVNGPPVNEREAEIIVQVFDALAAVSGEVFKDFGSIRFVIEFKVTAYLLITTKVKRLFIA